ncbi:MAG: glycoside hydrolase family 3 C-terminal domain-containing protein [Lachnospiraceae bacterium]|nr:glycoside hydrolase family 3 C-terminal domain-containing protein [Lachnospiraceae bacterium]
MNLDQALGFMTGKCGKHHYPEHMKDSRKIATEGIVLLKNENNILPLKDKKVALFGAGATQTSVCGTGSGYVMAPYVVSIYEGLKNAGFQITSEGWIRRYDDLYKKTNKEDKTLTKINRAWSGLSILVDDIEVTDEDVTNAKSADTAIYVVRRNAGEGGDRKAEKGDYYLSDMEEQNIKKVAAAFEHTIVVFNTCVMDAGFINTIPGIEGAILLGQAGMEAGNALADVICGKVSPSGHLTDSWAKKYEDNPASATFSSNDGNSMQEDYVEDIYVGYRYFDTFDVEPLFPFGYGLSYSKPEFKLRNITADWENISLELEVVNVGEVASKFVAQVYVSAPIGRLNKPYQELKGYKKTVEIRPKEKDVLKIVIPTESLASYDMDQAAFVMEPGKYLFRIGNDSRDNAVMAIVELDAETKVRQVSNQLKADKELNVLVTPEKCVNRIKTETEEAVAACEANTVCAVKLNADECVTIDGAAKPVSKRVSGKGNPDSTFIDVVEGRVEMKDFVDSLDEEVLFRLVAGAADEVKHETPKRTKKKYKAVGGPSSSGSTTALYVNSLGIPNWKVTDGPAGCHLPFCGVTGWPVGMVVAATWNDELSELQGKGIGKELEYYSHSIILGPGMNIHRDPLGGRSFEYYSEDPYVSGKMAAAMTVGVQQTPGAGVSIKHFACNNQENDRSEQNNTVTERALREIYLRGFEICVREANPKTVMTSYNLINGTYTSSSYDLITNILRGEWGFKGLVMTDWGSKSEKHLDLAAGNDLIMGGYRSEFLKAAVHGTPAQFDEDGYVHCEEFKVFGGFFKNTVEFWNAFKLDANGSDEIKTEVKAGVELNEKVKERVDEGVAIVTENADGSKTVTYKGVDRGAYLDIEDVKTCATRTLEQIADSISYRKMMKK